MKRVEVKYTEVDWHRRGAQTTTALEDKSNLGLQDGNNRI